MIVLGLLNFASFRTMWVRLPILPPAQQPNAHTFKLTYFQLGMPLYSHIPPHTTKCTVHTYPCTFKYTIKYSNFIDIKLNSYSSPSCIWYTGCIFMGPSPHNTMNTFSRAFNLTCFSFPPHTTKCTHGYIWFQTGMLLYSHISPDAII